MDQGFYFYFFLLLVVRVVTDAVNRSFNCTLNSQCHSVRVSGAGSRRAPRVPRLLLRPRPRPVGTAGVSLQLAQFHCRINSYVFCLGFPLQCHFLVPDENVSFPFSSWRPTDRNGGCWGGVSLGGMCPASEALVTAGVRAPTQPIPSVCSWGTLRPRLHRRAPRWSCPTRPASRGGVTLSGASPVPERRPGLPRQWGPQPRAGLWKPSWSASLPRGGVVTDTSSPPGFRGAFASPAPRLPRDTAVPLLLLSGSVNCLCSDIKNVRFLCE